MPRWLDLWRRRWPIAAKWCCYAKRSKGLMRAPSQAEARALFIFEEKRPNVRLFCVQRSSKSRARVEQKQCSTKNCSGSIESRLFLGVPFRIRFEMAPRCCSPIEVLSPCLCTDDVDKQALLVVVVVVVVSSPLPLPLPLPITSKVLDSHFVDSKEWRVAGTWSVSKRPLCPALHSCTHARGRCAFSRRVNGAHRVCRRDGERHAQDCCARAKRAAATCVSRWSRRTMAIG